LPDTIPTTAFAFRGYDIANLGRTPELLDHPAYGPTVEAALREGSDVCRAATGRTTDLVGRVRRREETRGLDTYAEDVALVVSVSIAQVRLLEERFAAPLRRAKLAFGYSLGELSALIAAGVYGLADLLRVPLTLAGDAVALAGDVTMGVLFSRGAALDLAAVRHLCLEINQQGAGVIGVSSHLSPNCVLLLGQGGTVDRFAAGMRSRLAGPVALRKNPHRWPPLHTPITWQRAIPNRAAVLLQTAPGGLTAPPVPVLSGVTGRADYAADNSRDLLHQWIDHPQRLWDQVAGTLAAGARTVVHVGPAPNLIPATFRRLAEDVRGQLDGRSPGSLGRRVVSRLARRPWLAQLLPAGAALLRAPAVEHINLEDWLLEQGGATGVARPALAGSAAQAP
jgi:[acyl-carrier-protein] S-malonyltransferase